MMTKNTLRTFHIWNRITGEHLGVEDAQSEHHALAQATADPFIREYAAACARMRKGYSLWAEDVGAAEEG